MNQFTVAFLPRLPGVDPEPVGLDQATADQFAPTEVTITADPG